MKSKDGWMKVEWVDNHVFLSREEIETPDDFERALNNGKCPFCLSKEHGVSGQMIRKGTSVRTLV